MKAFAFGRFWAVVSKEFVQMRRDRLTLAMMVGIPLVQLILFGYAINSDPKHLPLAIHCADRSVFSRNIVAGLQNSEYFDPVENIDSLAHARLLLDRGEVTFVLYISDVFSKRLLRGETPTILLEADATDPMATGNAISAFQVVVDRSIRRELVGPLSYLNTGDPLVDARVHRNYNPEANTQYNIVPGLMGVILTLTMVFITGLAITREKERGTMENLLSMPVRPLEVMLGKIVPYILIGYVQIFLILAASKLLFKVPILGNPGILLIVSGLFIAANLSVGVTFSTIAKNQLQAVQLSIFFFLPSLLLSGFMFPFRGMPQWAQFIGHVLPLTHYLKIVRGIFLKGNGVIEIWPEVWPIAVFMLVVLTVGVKRYSQTLDD